MAKKHDAQLLVERARALFAALEADPDLTLLGCDTGMRRTPGDVKKKLASYQATARPEQLPWLGEITMLYLRWVHGKYPDRDAAEAAFERERAEGRCDLGARAGFIHADWPPELFYPKKGVIPGHPHLKRLDHYSHDQFHPIAVDLRPEADFAVRMGDDYDATFDTGSPLTLGGYYTMVLAGGGLGRKEFMLRSRTAKARPVLDPVGWFADFDVAKTVRLIKGDPEAIAAWKAIAEQVPAV